MQIAALELQSCSSRKKPINFQASEEPSKYFKHKAGDGLRFLSGIGKGFRGTDAMKMKEQKREMKRLMNGKNLLPESRASSSNELVEISPTNSSRVKACSDSSEGKQVKQVSETGKIKKLSERLKILEEETEPLKQEIFQHMEERKKLVVEIYQQFQTIHHRLQFENQVREEGSPRDGSSIVKFLKVLCIQNMAWKKVIEVLESSSSNQKAGLGMAGQKSYTDSEVHALFEEGMERLS
ncbi:hypothetical protein SADUNF_Sadunf03G0016800 [Salix dunnii]|uniref:Uncharacterized protein n=1 Tax=Salix dunnii TaxID=1413687 RepID=A0A835KCW7_9ROSI|nr:hypothetical protein SADUNF_Sadunf03G0016800 [Salix dunnii]